MPWIKKGLIYCPNGELDFSQSHAQVPVVDYLEQENRFRVYFSTRDGESRSLPSYIEVNADNPSEILKISDRPILELGKLGTFDDCGVMPSWIVNRDNEKYMYYIGWNVRNTISYHNSVGLAKSYDGGVTFTKLSDGPLWDRNYIEPHYSGTSCVLIDDDGIWKNWYLSCTEWKVIDGKSEPRYHIKYAESMDGINWTRNGEVAIDYIDDEEAGIVKASVIKEKDVYRMWFSYRNFSNYRTDRNNSYRIGYAESNDGKSWQRFNCEESPFGLDVSESGWDSQMVEYPHVVKHKGKLLMFYNGNGFGASGFGYAVYEE
ncbi:hypothetical protein L3I75_002117 [Vibrio vulnificus]|uniref:hypothetical protein n=1 Tax=Vibrio vulnificus TaxID=672 RepID=UPI0013021E51|nr:hypothetical protein [Vibrio vulnificus]EIU7613854.1 hypothetical protein [Vibrio vulnificus]EIU7863012.1 hypothetical protein [Vibrio vulnificus]MCU8205249.1 hypothetical protein [Vibrio vulnificus]MCU8261733.1 hypothetical protein [Vibrio vulnificus]MCU8348077.1 hypothetical protein [Vibrio vulnificus]